MTGPESLASKAMPLVAAIEAGGTKFRCAVGYGPGDGVLAQSTFPTGDDPQPLLADIVAWFRAQEHQHSRYSALGVASFGPVDLDPVSPTYGFITTTPKPGWQQTDLLDALRQAFPHRPIGFNTDTNGAALGEAIWGAARGLEDFVYITMGTGIGAGGMARGRLLQGLIHPEMGHLFLPWHEADDFLGVCPFHGRCWEGLCSGPAVAARTGQPAECLPADHPVWNLVIQYTSWAIANIVMVLSPRRVILGGSVRRAGQLGEAAFFQRLREKLQAVLNGYLAHPMFQSRGLADFLVPPQLGDDAGLCGAMALAHAVLPQSATEQN